MVEIGNARLRLSSRPATAILTGIGLGPKSVDEALHALETVAHRLRERGDARAAFPDIYSIITRKVADQVRVGDGMFLEPRWISRLAGRFCERYLETLRWSLDPSDQDCDAWTAAYACSSLPIAVPAQHVLLGLSAHINFDLAVGIYETIVEFGHGDSPEMIARYKHDHDQVNALLLASIPEAFEQLSKRHGCIVSAMVYARAYPSARWITMQLLTRWRSAVWTNVRALLDARSPAERDAVIARMKRRSGLYGRLFQLPSAIASAPFTAPEPPSRKGAEVIPFVRAAKASVRPRWAASLCPIDRLCA